MRLAHEMPLFMLKNGAEKQLSDYTYLLVHLFDEYPEYYDYAVEVLKEGREVILDNSIFELGSAFDVEKYVEWIQKLVKDTGDAKINLTVVIPDTFDDSSATIQQTYDFLNKQAPKIPYAVKYMAVAQGPTLEELSWCYTKLAQEPEISKVGINHLSKAFLNLVRVHAPGEKVDELIAKTNGRKLFIEHLYHNDLIIKPLHLLGLLLPDEYGYYIEEHPRLGRFIETADTSNPVVHGLLGIIYKGPQGLREKASMKMAEMMSVVPTQKQIEDVGYNLGYFRSMNFMESKVETE